MLPISIRFLGLKVPSSTNFSNKTYTLSTRSLPKDRLCGLRLKYIASLKVSTTLLSLSLPIYLNLLQPFTYRIQPKRAGPQGIVHNKHKFYLPQP